MGACGPIISTTTHDAARVGRRADKDPAQDQASFQSTPQHRTAPTNNTAIATAHNSSARHERRRQSLSARDLFRVRLEENSGEDMSTAPSIGSRGRRSGTSPVGVRRRRAFSGGGGAVTTTTVPRLEEPALLGAGTKADPAAGVTSSTRGGGRVNGLPSVVVLFHSFQSSFLAGLCDASWTILIDLMTKMLWTAVGVGAMVVSWHVLVTTLVVGMRWLCLTATAGATFLLCEVVAMILCGKTSALIGSAHRSVDQPRLQDEDLKTSLLPRLRTRHTAVVTARSEPESEAGIEKCQRVGRQWKKQQVPLRHGLPLLRRRILTQLRAPPINVNGVQGERRKRAQVVLAQATIRVGKAYARYTTDRTLLRKRKQEDVYMVRVDCSQPGDKHMNPVVMWDLTATFSEFRKLEKSLLREVMVKRVADVKVPHLKSDAVLFVQPELTQHVLNARRNQLQTFINGILANSTLADSDAMRKFCQAW